MKKKIVVAALAAAVSVFSLTGCGAAYTKPIDDLFKGVTKGDAELIMGSVYDEEMFDDADMDYDDVVDMMDDYMDLIVDSLEDEFGDHVKITYKVTDKDELSKKEIKKLEEQYEDEFDFKADIKKGYELELDVKIKGSDDKDSNEMEMTVVNIDGIGWKLAPDSMDGMGSMF